MLANHQTWLLSLLALTASTTSIDLPVKLEVKVPLDSRSANVHVSGAHHALYPYTVTFGACGASENVKPNTHIISEVHNQATERLIWVLPDDVSANGCLSAWSPASELVGRSSPLDINKLSRQWVKKRDLDHAKLKKRQSIPMTNASGIDAEGPWFDGVELLKNKEISALNATEAKAKSKIPS